MARVWPVPARLDVTPAAAISSSNNVDFPLPVGPTSAIARGFVAIADDVSGMLMAFLPDIQITDEPVSDERPRGGRTRAALLLEHEL
jgi:hypothetical protein